MLQRKSQIYKTPQSFSDMMFLNEREMKDMLNDVSQIDYDIPGDGKLLEMLDKLTNEATALSRDDAKKKDLNPIKGIDFSLATKIHDEILRNATKDSNLEKKILRRIRRKILRMLAEKSIKK